MKRAMTSEKPLEFAPLEIAQSVKMCNEKKAIDTSIVSSLFLMGKAEVC